MQQLSENIRPGVLERWSVGVLPKDFSRFYFPELQHSFTPILHYVLAYKYDITLN